MVRTTVTSATGTYVMPALPTGLYKVTAELAGFGTVAKEGIRLAVGESASLGFTLKVAAVAETITVQGESPLVDTKKSELSGRVEQKQVENLPVNGRDWLGLVSLVPGARGNPGAIQAGSSGSDMAKYQVDGVDVTNQCCGGSNQGYSKENIDEFKVETNRYDAEYGRVNGAVINAVTSRAPTGAGDRVRLLPPGPLFRSVSDAPSFFTGKIAPFDQKQTGVNSGGPIVKNKAFYFAQLRVPEARRHRAAEHRLRAVRRRCAADTTTHFTTGARTSSRTPRIGCSAGVDLRLEAAERRRQRHDDPVGGYSRPSSNHDFSLGDTWVISSRAVNEVRAGFSAIDNLLDSNCHCVQLNFPSAIIGSPTNSPQWWKEMNIQVNDLFSYFVPGWHGEHSLKMGFQFFRPKFWGAFPDPAFGQFTFTSDPANFNDPATYPAPTRYMTPLGDTSYKIMNPTYGAFFQDNWTLNRKLTLNLGLRYDLETGTSNTECRARSSPARGRSTRTTSRRASGSPTTFRPTAVASSAAASAATSTR